MFIEGDATPVDVESSDERAKGGGPRNWHDMLGGHALNKQEEPPEKEDLRKHTSRFWNC